jgi:UPF0271 protein
MGRFDVAGAVRPAAAPAPPGPGRAGHIDINADLGEGPTVAESLAIDEPILSLVTSTNVATGAHAGGGAVLAAVTQAAVAAGVAVGAHPSYRDRAGFGRVSLLPAIASSPQARREFVSDLVGQVIVVAAALDRWGHQLRHCKPHGALYNDAVAHPAAAQVVLEATEQAATTLGYRVPLVTLPHGHLWQACHAAGWPVRGEGFIDRAYTPAGTLVPRSQPGSVLDDRETMVANALALAGRGVATLCVHGDTPGALAAAQAVRAALVGAGWTVSAP